MSDCNATTLPIPVKDVRSAAQACLQLRQEAINRQLTELVENMNNAISVNNAKSWRRLFKMQPQPLLNVEDTVSGWREDFRRGQLPTHSNPWWILFKTHTNWWKRLVMLTELPVADDERIMRVSTDDIELISYNMWRLEQQLSTIRQGQA